METYAGFSFAAFSSGPRQREKRTTVMGVALASVFGSMLGLFVDVICDGTNPAPLSQQWRACIS